MGFTVTRHDDVVALLRDRRFHSAVGMLAQLLGVSDADLASVSRHLTPEVRDVLSVRGALAARRTFGSTGPEPVAEQLAAVGDRLAGWREWAAERAVRH